MSCDERDDVSLCPAKTRRLALTIGDPNGNGPEIAAKAATKLEPGAEKPITRPGNPTRTA
jgi:hypothetical protein